MSEAHVWCVCTLMGCCLLAGCTNPGYDTRRDAAETLRASLQEETAQYVAAHPGALSLSNAVVLARQRTLKLTQQDLDRHLARVSRDAAFSVFLPKVNVAYGRDALMDVRAETGTALGALSTGTVDVGMTSIMLTQPLFTPVAWLMFAESRYGVRIHDCIRARARELLDVQVASIFYQTAIADRMVATYQAQYAAGQALTNQLTQLAEHGYARGADRARAEARMAADALSLQQAKDARILVRARLCDVLRFWPLAEVRVDGGTLAEVLTYPWLLRDTNGVRVATNRDTVVAMPLEDIVWQTLVNRKELYAGDQTIALRKTQVLTALAGFLPNIVGQAGGQRFDSGDLMLKYWSGGAMASWAIFEGFQTVQQYRAARARREAEYRLQEDRTMTYIVATVRAWQAWRQCAAQCAAAKALLRAAELDYNEAKNRNANGQETMSVVLDKLAAKDAASVQSISAEYATALAELTLRQAMGIALLPVEEEEAQ